MKRFAPKETSAVHVFLAVLKGALGFIFGALIGAALYLAATL